MSTTALSDNRYTRGIARFVSELRYEAIPQEVLGRIKLLMLDSLGCAIYGADLEWSRILQKTLTGLDTTQACAVWGTRHKLSAPHAALVNGTQVQGFELDDVHRQGVLHVGAVVLPALISIAEIRGTSVPGRSQPSPGAAVAQRQAGTPMTGREFLAAAVAGYEIGPRVGICMGPEHIAQGWHSGATLGVFSAAAGAARGLGLDVDRTVHALGIAGTQSAGLMAAQYGAMVKRMHAGRSSQSGLYGALFAEQGFTGIVNVLESEYGGFCSTFSRSQDRFQLEALTAGLGQDWQTMGVALKFYSCVGSNHSTLDAIRAMQAERPFGAEDVEDILVHGSQVTMDHVGWKYEPQGLTSAQLNLPYCVATWLLDGDCFVDQFTEDKVADPDRMRIAEKVRVAHDPGITAKGSKFRHMVRVEVTLRDGTHMERTVEAGRGNEKNFASESDIVEKFEKLATHVLPRGQVEEIRDCVLGLDELEDCGVLPRLLAARD
ncbi:2-methylcitrate dehydratase [Bordetella genomosp. 10]|uniref:2-methylcitrate dehydratase n=1 Tax=Bordetella genomosp. 10 TaxID=1416804 RepID=A0A261S210_9BORD|nr:MmgE/PrpD family protein [Bordetella genomosp. 10]OZI30533.1 2-methylcitrate dehydratase [Bordetella genomosp. 10]